MFKTLLIEICLNQNALFAVRERFSGTNKGACFASFKLPANLDYKKNDRRTVRFNIPCVPKVDSLPVGANHSILATQKCDSQVSVTRSQTFEVNTLVSTIQNSRTGKVDPSDPYIILSQERKKKRRKDKKKRQESDKRLGLSVTTSGVFSWLFGSGNFWLHTMMFPTSTYMGVCMSTCMYICSGAHLHHCMYMSRTHNTHIHAHTTNTTHNNEFSTRVVIKCFGR